MIVPKIVHIRIYLPSYIMLWRHVSGPLSVGGNFMSRMHQYAKPATLENTPKKSATESSIAIIAKDDFTSAFDSIHGSRNGHLGYRATVTQQYTPVLQVLVKYVFSTYLYRKYFWSTRRSSSGYASLSSLPVSLTHL